MIPSEPKRCGCGGLCDSNIPCPMEYNYREPKAPPVPKFPFTERPYVVGSGVKVGVDADGAFFFEGNIISGAPTPAGNLRWRVQDGQARAFFEALEGLKESFHYQRGLINR